MISKVMFKNISFLEKQAIDLALKGSWKSAISVNQDILEVDPNNIQAKMRLGKALLQTKDFGKAKKIFEEILKNDPVNQIALKNLKIAKEKRVDNQVFFDNEKLIKMPGTSTEVTFEVKNRRIKLDNFISGEEILLKIHKHMIETFKKNLLLGVIETRQVIQSLNQAKTEKAKIEASYIKHKDFMITILITSSTPVFKWEKQDIKPYIKKGTLDEPELEMPTTEEIES